MRDLWSQLPAAALTAGIIVVLLTTGHAQAPHKGARVHRRDASDRPRPTAITREQMERLEARVVAVTAFVNRLEPEAKAKGLASGWRQSALETVLPLPLDALQLIEREALALDGLAGAARMSARGNLVAPAPYAAEDPAALGQSDLDLVYTPISPCRYIDTRNAGGKINGVRGFDFDLSGAAHGGQAACTFKQFNAFPDDIGALAMNVTLVDTSTAATPGFVAVKPTASAPTTSLLNWYDQGPGVQMANQGVVSLFQNLGTNEEFVIQTSGAVHIVVDIFGAFVAPHATALQTVHLLNFVVVQSQPFQFGFVESPPCPGGYTLTGGGCYTDEGDARNLALLSNYPGLNDNRRWACRSQNTTGVAKFLFARAICSRVPGR